MISPFAARRAAEEFADLVDRPVDEHASGRAAQRHADLVATVTALREQTAITPRAEFVADLRARLMAAADTALVPAPAGARSTVVALPARKTSHRIGSAAAAALVVVGGTAGLAAAAQSALPGEALYPIKRGIESAATAFNTSDAGRGADLLGQAGTRLEEAVTLTRDGASAEKVESAVTDFADQAGEGADLLFASYRSSGDTADVAKVQDFTARSMGTLAALAEDAPADARPEIRAAAQTLSDIDTQARTLCAACGGLELSGFALPTETDGVAQLVTGPALAAEAQQQLLEQVGDLGQIAEAEAGQLPPESTTGSGTTGVPTAPQPASPTPVEGQSPAPGLPEVPIDREDVQVVTGPVKNTIQGTTDGVTGLIKEITGSTPLAPVTDPLTETLDQTVDSLTNGLLP